MNAEHLLVPNMAELLSARDIATLLGLTPRVVRLNMQRWKIAHTEEREGVRLWAFEAIPHYYQTQLAMVRKKSGHWTFQDALRQAVPKWTPPKKFSELPAFTQGKALKVRQVMVVYFAALDDGMPEKQANHLARSKWLELFAAACSAPSIYRWAAKTELRGGVEHAPLEAYADQKSCNHLRARAAHRAKDRVPFELIREFKSLCVGPDMNIATAYRKLEMDWTCGREVPASARWKKAASRSPSPITRCSSSRPSAAARRQGNRGKAEAQRDALSHMTRTYGDLQPCQLILLDDTRVNVSVKDDETGDIVEVFCYIAIDAATRKVIGYVLRIGHMQAEDTDRLISRIFRTAGMAHLNAGYRTTLLFERGAVACTTQREGFLRSMYPQQLDIRRTSMDGGQNFPGDYVQSASGHWMGKGPIESFMRTLGYITRHLAASAAAHGAPFRPWSAIPAPCTQAAK